MGTHLAHFLATVNSQLRQTSSMSMFSSNRLYQHPVAESVQVCTRVKDGVIYTTCVI